METGAYNIAWPYVHMQPEETIRAYQDLRGHWLLPIHNGTFDLAMHPWYEPFERVLDLAAERGIKVATPIMGERVRQAHRAKANAAWRALIGATK